ncbi:MAG TPA: malto-oligosyltrehalose synthase [Gaiellaceae bacterium]|nr:malto-oligosyltrehalose synthase [Gaiellaceae bacterium]
MPDFRCTYRLQLTPELGFRRVREVVLPYLRDLGVSHLYLSPVMRARSGSLHGYDVVDPTRVSPELGGEEELRALCEAAGAAGLGTIVDVVPNHMAASEEENRFWRDPELRARYFDWDPASGWYRRFFDIGELAGVRVEDPEVFEATHAKILELVGEGLVDGLRIDHPDGLANPREYLERLRTGDVERIWVEKILEPGESLRADWPVEGTTGYEFANDVTALFVDPAGEEPLTELYAELTGERRSFAEVSAEAKLEVARTTFAREFERLRALVPLEGLEEAAASLHVYRTYVEPETGRVAPEDRHAVSGLPEELQQILLLENDGDPAAEFVVRWQQTTGPVMAKGVEDTAFYRWFRLTALNEVGGNPDRFSLSPDDFHRAALERLERHPHTLLASQTHDTKRAGDVRARIGALSALHEEWAERVRRWQELTGGMDDPNEEYLVWQTLVGAWPIVPGRLEPYLEKALREGKRTTNWLEPDEEHEWRAKEFVRGLYSNHEFLDDFEPFAVRVARAGEHASLGALLLRLTSPGLADLYQGDTLWSLNLVDPDNRRPVDWSAHVSVLREWAPTRRTMKAHLIRRVLRLRAERPEAFAGGYEPLDLGPDRVGFVRGGAIRVVVPLRFGDRADGGDIDLLPEYDQELSVLV